MFFVRVLPIWILEAQFIKGTSKLSIPNMIPLHMIMTLLLLRFVKLYSILFISNFEFAKVTPKFPIGNSGVAAVKLPTSEPSVGSAVIISGWGETSVSVIHCPMVLILQKKCCNL